MKNKLGFIFPLAGMQFVDDGVTSDMQVLMTGEWTHSGYGKFTVTEKDLDAMITNFETGSAQELCVDYQHMSLDDDPGKAIAAGWTKKLYKKVNEDEDRIELWAKTEWTEAAAERIKNKEYKYISPEFDSNYKNPDTGKKQGATLLAAALVNRPFLKGMAPVVLSEKVLIDLRKENIKSLLKLAEESLHDQISKISTAYFEQFPRKEDDFMGPWIKETFETHIIIEEGDTLTQVAYTINGNDITFGESVEVEQVYQEKKTLTTQGGDEMDRKLLCTQLGLKETATDDEINAELKRLKEQQDNKALVESLGLNKSATEQEVLEAVKKLKEAGSQTTTEDTVKLAEFSQLKSEHAQTKKLAEGLKKDKDALNLKLLEKDRNDVIGKALNEGRLLPKHKELWEKKFMENPDDTRELLETLEQPVVALGERGGDSPAHDTELTVEDRAVAKQLKLKENNYKKAEE